MDEYFLARYNDLLIMESATCGYAEEERAYRQEHPPMVFKRWLIESRGMPR